MKRVFGLVVLLSLFLCVGCATTNLGAPERVSTSKGEAGSFPCKEVATTHNPEVLTACAAIMHDAYSKHATDIMNGNRPMMELPLLGLAAVAGGVELYDGSRAITKGAGLLSGILTGLNTYWKPKDLADLYLAGSDQMLCVAVEGSALTASTNEHADKMIAMDSAYEEFEKAIKAAAPNLKSAEAIQWKARAESAMDSLYYACGRTTAARLVGGYEGAKDFVEARKASKDQAKKGAAGEPVKSAGSDGSAGKNTESNGRRLPVDRIRYALLDVERQMLSRYNGNRGDIAAIVKDVRKFVADAKDEAEKAEQMESATGEASDTAGEAPLKPSADTVAKAKADSKDKAAKEKADEMQALKDSVAALEKAVDAAKEMTPTVSRVSADSLGLEACTTSGGS